GYDLPMRFNLQTGYKIVLNYNKYHPAGNEISITPTLNYKHQGYGNQLDIGVYYTYDPIILGLWYRGIPGLSYGNNLPNNEAIIPMAGVTFNGFSFTYSYDYTISKLTNQSSGGSHEISLIYEFKKPYRNASIQKRLPCPQFNRTYQ
ncbi:MAG: type IX secretion system membrane protein PorP/SprF, partial [Cytophagales bacterium]|nr:type IX secretion system membrane protein PorP/SprF [Cytophaga sp.]